MDDEVRLLSSSMLVSPHHWWGILPRSTVCHHSFLVIKILVFPWALVQVCPSWHDIFLGWCRHFRSSSQPCLSPNVSFWWGNLPDGARTGSHGHMLLLVLCSFFQPSIQSTQSPHSVPDSTLSCSLVVLQVRSYLCDKVIMSSRTEIVWHVVASPRPPPARVWQEKPGGKHFLTWLWNARYTRDTFFTYLMGPRGPYKIHTVTYGKS